MSISGQPGRHHPLQGIWWKLLLIGAIIAGSILFINPPKERIRLGRDLRGGVSLIYRVNVDPTDPDPDSTLEQVITVLKDRVNPTGVLDISFQVLGRDRIEVVMPLPNSEVVALRNAYDAALDDLLNSAQIPAAELQRSLETGDAIARFGIGGGLRERKIQDLQAAYDTYQAAVKDYDEAKAANAGESAIGALAQAVADADASFDDLRDDVLKLSLDPARLERAMRLSTQSRDALGADGRPIIDPITGDPEREPSPRAVELDSLKGDFADLAAKIDAAAAAWDRYSARRTGYDDPEDLMRLLRGAGVLEYHIAVRGSSPVGVNPDDLRRQLAERGPDSTDSTVASWYRINDLKQWYEKPEELAQLQADPIGYFARRQDLVAGQFQGDHYLLLYDTPGASITHHEGKEWAIERTGRTIDNLGRPAVLFQLDAPGGMLMNRLTGQHINEPMAIVLDGQVYSAPNIKDTIGQSGIIVGNFTDADLEYLTRVLAAGSLRARLTPDPIAINTLGPSIGQDNLARGLWAFEAALVAVAGFMIFYYFFAGAVAVFALLINGLMIFGMMSMIDGTFTLPGLAGVVLTIGTAVDANVLIYERVREEIGKPDVNLRQAIKLGYSKALSAIVDSNVTNLIVCAVLYQTATTEVKGFALTLALGIVATLFTALFVTRQVYLIYTEVFKIKTLPMLATTVPVVQRLLEPKIDWMGLRKIFIPASGLLMLASVVIIGVRGRDLFDTEFRGGVSVTMVTAIVDADGDGQPDARTAGGEPVRAMLPLTGPGGVETRIRSLSTAMVAGADPARRQRLEAALRSAGLSGETQQTVLEDVLRELGKAGVLTVGDTESRGGVVHSSRFQARIAGGAGLENETVVTDIIVAAIVAELGDSLDVTRPLSFRGAGEMAHAGFTHPITEDTLGTVIERPRYTDRVADSLGGVAIVVDDIVPPVTLEDLRNRIARMRSQPDFASEVGRRVAVFGLEAADPQDPSKGYRSAAVTVSDPALSYFNVDLALWERELAAREWALLSAALQRQTSLEEVQSISSSVAATLSANATVATALSLLGIMVYVWIRFGSLRYSLGAIVALIHDATIATGALAASRWLSETEVGRFLLISDFRIDLGVVAGILTVIGYSLNDTIVILDRIRENRGKLPIPTPEIVNASINQTFSRTVITQLTVVISIFVIYVAGGTGIRPFAFVLLVGMVVGTYSSVAIAAPLVTSRATPAHRRVPAGAKARRHPEEPQPGVA